MESSQSPKLSTKSFRPVSVGINPTICIIDDNDDSLFLYEWIFTRYLPNYTFHLFSDGIFLQKYQNPANQKPDLILLDLKMPYISGIELLARLKQDAQWQRIPVIVFTNSDSPRDEEACYEAGASDFVKKAFSVNTIKAQLETICQQWLGYKHLPL